MKDGERKIAPLIDEYSKGKLADNCNFSAAAPEIPGQWYRVTKKKAHKSLKAPEQANQSTSQSKSDHRLQKNQSHTKQMSSLPQVPSMDVSSFPPLCSSIKHPYAMTATKRVSNSSASIVKQMFSSNVISDSNQFGQSLCAPSAGIKSSCQSMSAHQPDPCTSDDRSISPPPKRHNSTTQQQSGAQYYQDSGPTTLATDHLVANGSSFEKNSATSNRSSGSDFVFVERHRDLYIEHGVKIQEELAGYYPQARVNTGSKYKIATEEEWRDIGGQTHRTAFENPEDVKEGKCQHTICMQYIALLELCVSLMSKPKEDLFNE